MTQGNEIAEPVPSEARDLFAPRNDKKDSIKE